MSVIDLYPTFGDHVPGPSCPCHPEVVNTANETVYNHQSISNLGAKLRAALARAAAAAAQLAAANEDAARVAVE